jgi:ABC-type transport system involved in multi-copper enzyme maturation permease subunit
MRIPDARRVRGIVCYELRMRRRSWLYWIVALLANALALFVPTPLNYPGPEEARSFYSSAWMAGQAFSSLSLVMTLAGALLAADRILRDATLRTKEAIKAKPVGNTEYVLGKYLACLIAMAVVALPVLVGIPVIKQRITGTGMDLAPLLAAWFTMYIAPMAFVAAVALAAATLLGNVRAFYVGYAVLWYFDSLRYRWASSLTRGVFNFSGTTPYQAFFSPVALSLAVDPQQPKLAVGVAAANVLFLLLASALLVGLLVHLEKRGRKAGPATVGGGG